MMCWGGMRGNNRGIVHYIFIQIQFEMQLVDTEDSDATAERNRNRQIACLVCHDDGQRTWRQGSRLDEKSHNGEGDLAEGSLGTSIKVGSPSSC